MTIFLKPCLKRLHCADGTASGFQHQLYGEKGLSRGRSGRHSTIQKHSRSCFLTLEQRRQAFGRPNMPFRLCERNAVLKRVLKGEQHVVRAEMIMPFVEPLGLAITKRVSLKKGPEGNHFSERLIFFAEPPAAASECVYVCVCV